MISFAPFFYPQLLNNKEIIQDVNYYDVFLINGDHLFESQVTLNSMLRNNFDNSEIYSDVDGGGTSKYKNIAVYKSISEAFERWAFYENVNSKLGRSEYGFDINPTTTGMAAFPSFSTKSSRILAHNEAVERYILDSFNHGIGIHIEHETNIKGLKYFELKTPFKNHFVTILNYNLDSKSYYGFSSGRTLEDSFSHSMVELCRNMRVLAKIPLDKGIASFANINDRRLVYYSTIEGNLEFLENFTRLSKKLPIKPQIKIDSEIRGSWSRYTKVYRILFDQSYVEKIDKLNYFLF